jgi:hypothetical protein
LVQLIIHHRWLIRLCLGAFWITEFVAWLLGYGFLTYLAQKYTWALLIIFFLTFKYMLEPFYLPFIKITSEGGETIMEKSTKILCVIIAILGSLLGAILLFEDARNWIITTTNKSVLQPIMGSWLGFVNWLDGFRASYMLGFGLLGGLILAVVINTIALPKIRHTKISTPNLPGLDIQREPAEPEPSPIPRDLVEEPVSAEA